MGNKYLTDDELISAMNHSSESYIIVEGPDDVMIYRWLLEDIDCEGLLEPREGCGSVKRLYRRKNEITNPKVAFICDKDTIVYTGTIPKDCLGIIYTEGYSIENDLYQGKHIETHYFRKKDKELFSTALDSFLKAYACELEKFRAATEYDFTINPEVVLDKTNYSLKTDELNDYKEPSDKTVNYLRDNYDILLRGHSLFSLVRIVLGRKDRDVKYSLKHLYDLCYCNKSDSILKMQNRIIESIKYKAKQ